MKEQLLSSEDGVYLFSVASELSNIAYLGEGSTPEEAKVDAYRTKELAEDKSEVETNMTFGQAIEVLKNGEKVARTGWNGKGMFLYYVPAASYPAQRNSKGTMQGVFPDDMVPYCAYIAMKTAQNNVVPWLASQTDVLAEDWQLA